MRIYKTSTGVRNMICESKIATTHTNKVDHSNQWHFYSVLFVSHSSSSQGPVSNLIYVLSNVRMTALLVVIKLLQANDYLRLRIYNGWIEDVTVVAHK